jgi:hypothetical protein
VPRWVVLMVVVVTLVVSGGVATTEPAWQPSPQPQATAGDSFWIRVSFGHGAAPQERWSGSVRAENARLVEVKGWLLRADDRLSLNAFELQTINARTKAGEPKGITVRGTGGGSGRVVVTTERGKFSIALSDLDPGRELEFLDGTVRATGMLRVDKLSDERREDDYPSIAVSGKGTAWAVWQSYSGRTDQIRLSKYDQGWRTFTIVPGVSGDVWRPQIAADRRGFIWVVWAQQVAGNFDVYARALDEGQNRWLETIRLSSDPGSDIDPRLFADAQGGLWVVWQGFRADNSDIFLRHYDGAQWQREVRITDSSANDWEPAVAVDSRGRAHVAWDSYRSGNYDVYSRTYDNGTLGPELRVTESPRFEAHASVAVDKADRVWIVWDEGSANWGKDTGPTIDPRWLERGAKTWEDWINNPSAPGARLYETRKLDLAVFEGSERKAPAASLRAALESAGIADHDFPQLLVDPSSGRIAVVFHRWNQVAPIASLGFKPTYWEHAVTFYDGNRWSRPQTMPESWGRPSMRSSAAFAADGTLWMIWPTDNRLAFRPVQNIMATIFAARIPPAGGAAGPELIRATEAAADLKAPVHPNEPADVRAIRSYRTYIHGAENRIVRGDLHRHTEFSWDSSGGMVDGSLFDFYRYMLDAAAMDFGAVTDHNSGGDYEYGWWLIEKSCDMYHVPRSFTTLYGYERSVQFPGGHRNVLHTQRGIPVVPFFTKPGLERPRPPVAAEWVMVAEDDAKLLYESIRRTGGIAIPHTTGSNMGTDWRYHDQELGPVVEIFQGDRISYEAPGAPRAPRSADDKPIGGYQESGLVWSAYRKGLRIGTIASSDHWSTHISYALVYTEQPTREAIFDAIKRRRTYGATDNIVLDYRMGEHFMGEEFEAAKIPPLDLHVAGTAPVARIEIVKNEKVVFTATPGRKEVVLRYQDEERSAGSSYYYVRVLQDDRAIAWGSPIWVSYRP